MPTTSPQPASLRSPGRAVRAFVTALTIVFGVVALASPARAQDEGTTDEATSAAAPTEVTGVLKTKDDNGDDVFLEGVEFIVTDLEGVEVGRATTDANGFWRVELPGAGTYFTQLNEETLDGVSLRNPDRNPLEFSVKEGDSRPNLFPLGERAASTGGTVQIVQLTVDGIKLGLLIAMSAIGLSLIYGTTGLVNFAHGEMVTFGGMMAYLLHVRGIFGWAPSLILGAIFAFVMSGIAGGAFNQFVWKPLRDRGASLISALVVSLGFSILIRYIIQYLFGGRPGFYRDYRIQSKWDFGIFTLAPKDAFIILFSILVLILIAVGLQKTRAGKAMRAVADNRDLAESSGIDVERVTRWVWVAGSALAGLGGVLFGVTESIGWDSGFRVLLLMFAGVTLGGLGTAYGALIGSLIIGVFIQVSTLVIPSDMKNVGALIALVAILLVRPQGLLGRPERIG
jgi:branched-chain amino acid transport system permease protein